MSATYRVSIDRSSSVSDRYVEWATLNVIVEASHWRPIEPTPVEPIGDERLDDVRTESLRYLYVIIAITGRFFSP